MEEAVLVSGVRTAIGRFGGGLRDVPAAELGGTVIKAALERAGVSPQEVDEVIMGCVGQIAEDAYIARRCAVAAGLPFDIPALSVNRICGSGLEAVNIACRMVRGGEAEIVVAGGTENMSQLPYYVRKGRWGYRLGDATLEDGVTQMLNCGINHYHMGITAENVAERHVISREEQDAYAVRSHQRAVAAIQGGLFSEQIVPVAVPQPRGEPVTVSVDEHPRPDSSVEQLARLPAFFKSGGCVTAGNTSGLNDAAAAVVVMSERTARARGVRPRLLARAWATAGVDPAYMGMGPVPATRKALQRAGRSLGEVDLVELNEAFAVTTLAVMQELDLDGERVNVHGGAVALGHPVGATGAILTVKLMHALEGRGDRLGLVTLCIGGGQGIATLFERP